MRSFKAYIDETYKNPGFNPDHEHYRELYRDQIHDILRKTYVKSGGYGGYASGSKEESDDIHKDISKSHMKINTVGGRVKSVQLYKHSKHGRKLIAGGTDDSKEGKIRYLKTARDDFQTRPERHAYIEAPHHEDPQHPSRTKGVRGAIEKITGGKVKKLKRAEAQKLMSDKKLEPMEGDEYGYTRTIGKKTGVKKIVLGNPKID